jgi:phosphoserine phosphatase
MSKQTPDLHMIPCVATLISNPDEPILTDAILAKLSNSINLPETPIWLCRGVSADIPCAWPSDFGNDLFRLRDNVLRAVLNLALPLDVVVQPQDGRRKKLLVADMDSTMIGQECIDELADYAGLKDRVAAITERAMAGEIAFAPALRERVALLKGLPIATIDKVIAERIRPNRGAATLIKTMRANGAYTCVVSGGFTAFMAPLAAAIGFDEYHANTLIMDVAGRLTGAVMEPVLGREAKRDALLALRVRFGLRREETIAVGDGANDIPMIEAAGLGVAFHGKPALREMADACIDHGDLSALLYAQGYRREQFVDTADDSKASCC